MGTRTESRPVGREQWRKLGGIRPARLIRIFGLAVALLGPLDRSGVGLVTSVMRQPDEVVLTACDKLDKAVGSIIRATSERRPDFGRWEAPVEAAILLGLLIRHLEGVIALARSDLFLLPAAMALSRSAFETGVRVRWLLLPKRDFDREARWLIHLEEEHRLWKRMSDLAQRTGLSVSAYEERARSISAFRSAVLDALPAGTTVPCGIPSVADALREQGEERRYIAYALLSQFVHGGHFAGTVWRRGLGSEKAISEKVTLWEWREVLRICWWSLYQSSRRFVNVACDPEGPPVGAKELQALESIFSSHEWESDKSGDGG